MKQFLINLTVLCTTFFTTTVQAHVITYKQTSNLTDMFETGNLTNGVAVANLPKEMVLATSASVSPVNVPLLGRTIDASYFGLHMKGVYYKPDSVQWPSVNFKSWRLSHGDFAWFSLEPVKGHWNFANLDRAIQIATYHRVDAMLTLGFPPAWASTLPLVKGPYVYGENGGPRDINDWRVYVQTVAKRYRGRIQYYELWNEPQLKEVDGPAANFSGAQLAQLAKVASEEIRKVDPTARIVSPSMVGGDRGVARLRSFLAGGGGQWVDIIGFHFYAWPEEIPNMVKTVQKVMTEYRLDKMPLWNTEFGFVISDPEHANTYPVGGGGSLGRVLDENEAAGFVARSLILGAAAGLDRFFWFGWDYRDMSLVRSYSDYSLKLPGKAYEITNKWLVGSKISPCNSISGTWSCDITLADGGYGRILWVEKESQAGLAKCPGGIVWKSYQTLFTLPILIEKECRIPLSGIPILLRAIEIR